MGIECIKCKTTVYFDKEPHECKCGFVGAGYFNSGIVFIDSKKKEEMKKERQLKIRTDIEFLKKNHVKFQLFNKGEHLRVAGVADYFPHSGLYMLKGKRSNGLKKLLKELDLLDEE